MKKSGLIASILTLLVGMNASLATAAITYDLTAAGSSATHNGAYFQEVASTGTGSGIFNPFVRLQDLPTDGTEQGYNTNNNTPAPFDEKGPFGPAPPPPATNDLTLGSVPILLDPVGLPAGYYFQFLLDGGEASDKLISLDEIQIFTTTLPSQNVNTFTGGVLDLGLSSLIYQLDGAPDGDAELLLNMVGNGNSDMQLLIPLTFFGTDPLSIDENLYVVLYSHFGGRGDDSSGNFSTSDGFEEWGALEGDGVVVLPPGGPPAVPEPASLVIWSALAGMGAMIRRNRR